MAAVTICSDFWSPQKIQSVTISPSICYEVMRPDAMILVFWMLSFKPFFSLSSFTFIKRLFSSSSLSAIRVVSSTCLRLSIFLLAILIPAYASSSPAFHMMYSAGILWYFLNFVSHCGCLLMCANSTLEFMANIVFPTLGALHPPLPTV